MGKLEEIQKNFGVGITSLREDYSPFKNLKLTMVSAASYGSGVSESAQTLHDYFCELGIKTSWQTIEAPKEFFEISKKISDALIGIKEVSSKDLAEFKKLSSQIKFDTDCDILYLHDHPALIAANYFTHIPKIYRCHFDISRSCVKTWQFIKPYIQKCQAAIFSLPSFHRSLEKINNKIFYVLPSIDPLSVKNKIASQKEIRQVFNQYKISYENPVILQVARFDKLKDPCGLIDVFNLVQKQIPSAQLVLAGALAPDDTEALTVYREALKKAHNNKAIKVLSLNKQDAQIAALQTGATVVVQKSLAESFGLAITEALWKSKPVVASNVGGIPLQITDKKTGLLCNGIESCSQTILRLLQDKALALRLGKNGHNLVRDRFLITRELSEHLKIFKKILQ
jgi:trehalose synthase